VQPTQVQVDASLAALQVAVDIEPRSDTEPNEVPAAVVAYLSSLAPVRADRVAEVRRRLAEASPPSDDELAARMVGRLVCDRLR
jgi:hypothetical protein